MTDSRSVLLTVVGRNFDGVDLAGLAAGNQIELVHLNDYERDLGRVVGDFAETSNHLYVGTGNLSFDAQVAAALGAPVIILYDRPGDHVELSASDVESYGAVVAEACEHERLAWAIGPALEKALDCEAVISPALFEHRLVIRARNAGSHIVLPEGDDDRILAAAAQVLAEGTAELTILGRSSEIKERAQKGGWDLTGAKIIDHLASPWIEDFAETFAELRKKKGVTLQQARETMKDVSYFATMMVYKGYADGMVSGAAHTTAHTIKPALQIIKTTPETSVVSSIFLMIMQGKRYAFGDSAVNPNPTAEQLGEIAVVSARTASQFGVDPKVALLSYSTGASGAGPDVEKVIAATERAKAIAPELDIDGPLQFDAAMEPSVAKKKMPDSPVAGQATVMIFPDLDAGNIGYKAVQRTAGALAVGPILQGLKKPVNDLSRGATVPDIVNTIAITAIQAGGSR